MKLNKGPLYKFASMAIEEEITDTCSLIKGLLASLIVSFVFIGLTSLCIFLIGCVICFLYEAVTTGYFDPGYYFQGNSQSIAFGSVFFWLGIIASVICSTVTGFVFALENPTFAAIYDAIKSKTCAKIEWIDDDAKD